MMFLCTSRFDLQEDSFTFLKEFFTLDEIEAGKEEEREYTPDQFELDPISDNEELGTQEEEEEEELPQANNDDDVVDLPYMESTQTRRISSRKRSREDDDQWAYY
jgi:hypothetical protein